MLSKPEGITVMIFGSNQAIGVLTATIALSAAGQPQAPSPPTPAPGDPRVVACRESGPGAPPPPGYSQWALIDEWAWVGEPERVLRETFDRHLGSETVRYRYDGPVPVPCGVPLVLTQQWEHERTVTHTVSVSGEYTVSLGIEVEAEIRAKRLLALETAIDAASMARLEGGWSGSWQERVASRQEVGVRICTELERNVYVNEAKVHWKTPVGRRLLWRAANGWDVLDVTSTCVVGHYRGAAIGYQNRVIDIVLRVLRHCPTDCT